MTARVSFISMNRLLSYYQKELAFLKQHGKVFASRFPKIARRLGMIEGESEDPHVERIIESFALLTSRIHQRLDDDMPELTEALLTTIAPQFLRVMPSTCIVSIEPNRQTSGITDRNSIAAGASLFSRHIDEAICQFQTVYPVVLLPLSLGQARLSFDEQSFNWHLHLSFQVWSGAVVAGETLRLFLHGPSNAVNILYTLLCSEIKQLSVYQDHAFYPLNSTAISPAGFKHEEGLIAQDPRVAPIHALIQDYFFFPQKFYFLDIQLPDNFHANASSEFSFEIIFNRTHLNHQLEKLAKVIDASFFRLNCTPAINLFAQRAEPIVLTENIAEYPVIPDIRRQKQIDVWAINHVFIQGKDEVERPIIPVQPLFGIDHSRIDGDTGIYWQSFLRETVTVTGAERKMFIAFANLNSQPVSPKTDMVTLSLTCTNGDIPSQIKNGHPDGDFDSDLPLANLKISALNRPTRTILPPDKSAVRWRLISQLSLNHMLLSGSQGVQVLRETLMLYNFHDRPAITRIINMILHLEVKPITARLVANDPQTLARGMALTLTFTHDALNEPEYFLLCCFLDHFLGLYAPVNSFTRVTTLIENEEHTRRIWPVRAGKLSWI
ncbi:type VI secretion system baseplate subunit TssF [Buttiauxella gaviniae]|uniref:Type VI secretion system baseplate subunit TssF n=1 Tax=Buttiauxella gaviniae TaxID=82990 RepID=A0ABV3NY89_9ENTR